MKNAIKTLVIFAAAALLITGCDHQDKKPVTQQPLPPQTENSSSTDTTSTEATPDTITNPDTNSSTEK